MSAADDHLRNEVYRQLRALAGSYFRGRRSDHTLSPTGLVHEAYLRLARQPGGWKDEAHFLAVAATAMRQILINHARDARAKKRGGGARERVTLSGLVADGSGADAALDVLVVDELLRELEALEPRQARLVELRVFGGLGEEELARVLGVSVRTVQKDWRGAKAWLVDRLAQVPPA
jgi:RNA polymerase sigma factor (TIGR02999 family)